MTQPDSRARRSRFADALTWVGGADRTILLAAPTSRGTFVQMGLVVLTTAALAIVSMTFALHSGMHLPWLLAVTGGLVWGCVIAVIDRFLVTTLNLRAGLWKSVVVIGARGCVAILLGIVISTPLVLQIFNTEIAAQVTRTNLEDSAASGEAVGKTAEAQQLADVEKRIAQHEQALKGQLPPGESEEVNERQEYLDKARQEYDSARATADQKRRAWQCELEGGSCEGSTDKPGNGNLAKSRQAEYEEAERRATAASRAVSQAEVDLQAARDAAAASGASALSQAQGVAKAELPGLYARRSELNARLNESVNTVSKTNSENTGLLAQLSALDRLGDADSTAKLTHYAVAGLLMMIELLPLLVKIMTSLGPPSAYDRIKEAAENTDVENAKIERRRTARQRDEDERRLAEDVRSAGLVADDMRERERELGIMANERVSEQMAEVLDVALARWAQDVQKTLAEAVPAGDGTASGNGRPVAASSPEAAAQVVHTTFNMPNGKNLGLKGTMTP